MVFAILLMLKDVSVCQASRVAALPVDSGMVVVLFICLMYIVLVFGLLFYVKNDWCDLLFKNMTVSSLFHAGGSLTQQNLGRFFKK